MNNITIKSKFIISFLTDFLSLIYPIIFFLIVLIFQPLIKHYINIEIFSLLILLVIFSFILSIPKAIIWIYNYKKRFILNSFINYKIFFNILSTILLISCLFIENKSFLIYSIIFSVCMFSLINTIFFMFFENVKLGKNDINRQIYEDYFIKWCDIKDILEETFDDFWIFDKKDSDDGFFYIYSKQKTFLFDNSSLVFEINGNWIYYEHIYEVQKELTKKLSAFNKDELYLFDIMYYS